MQVRNFFILLLFAFLLFNGTQVNAQKLTTNKNGEKIIVYPDGSWRYFDANEVEDVKEIEEANKEAANTDQTKKKSGKKKKRKKGSKKNKITDNNKDAAAENAARKEAILRAEQAAIEEQSAKLQVEEMVYRRIFLEDELADAYQNVDMTIEDVELLEEKLKEAKANEKEAKAIFKTASAYSKKMEKMIDMSSSKRDKLLAKMEGNKSESDNSASMEVINRASANSKEGMEPEEEAYATSAPLRPLKAYDQSKDVFFNPPPKACNLSFDDVDEFTGKKRKDVEKQTFFTYTPERFQPYFKGRNYITCMAYLSRLSDGPVFLNMEFVISTEQAAREFGVLERGSQMTIRGLDGTRVTLQNKKTATGIPNTLDKTTTYKAQYPIGSREEKMLKKLEVDKIRIIWGTGYEDYEVYEVDFLIDQFECINK